MTCRLVSAAHRPPPDGSLARLLRGWERWCLGPLIRRPLAPRRGAPGAREDPPEIQQPRDRP